MSQLYKVEVTDSAQRDLLAITEFLVQHHVEAVHTWLETLERHVQTLERFPSRCPLIPERSHFDLPYRHLVHGAFRVIFRIEGTQIFILRVLHGARLLDPSQIEPLGSS